MSDDDAWDAIERAAFTTWTGLPESASSAGFARRFPTAFEGEARVLLGTDRVDARCTMHSGERYPEHLRACAVGGALALIEADVPRLAEPLPVLLDSLGRPASRIDLAWGALVVPGGLLVHPDRGIAVGVGPEGRALHLELFAACDLDSYLRTVRRIPPRMTERP